MRQLIFIGGFLILCMKVNAQPLSPSLQLPDSIVQIEPEWVDLDNDGLLDIMLLMKSKLNKSYLGIIKGDTLNPLSEIEKTIPILSYQAYIVTDYDRDNVMDVLISGEKNGVPVTAVYLNKGEFNFAEKLLSLPSFTMGRVADLDSDAVPEMILSGTDANGAYLKILRQFSDVTWENVNDSVKLKCTSIETLDSDGDGDTDLFVSGTLKSGAYLSGFLVNNGDFHFKAANTIEMAGNTSKGDFNGDGFFEILLMAVDKNDKWHSKKYQYDAGAYVIQDISTVLKNGKPFIADFNYDGGVDVNFMGTNISGDTVNIIAYSNGEVDELSGFQLANQRFGDIDHDGNLDMLSIPRAESFMITLPNILRKLENEGPKVPKNAFAVMIFDRVFMYWDKPADDHTPIGSLTFDVHLNGEGNYQSGEFDLLNEKRLTVTHGNNGTQNFKLMEKVSLKGLKFAIQAIDNSFHPGRPCFGDGSVGCAALDIEEISTCSKETVVLTSPPEALWFSFAKGFLGVGKEFDFSSNAGDTLFYFNPKAEGCSALKTWSIKINDDTVKIEKNERYACPESTIEMSVEPGWDNITWTSMAKGNLGSSESIHYNVTQPDSIFASFSNNEGCKIIRKTAIKISKPELKLAADHYKIMKGSEVQLQVEGAQRYIWSPAVGLSQNNIPNPTASPSSSLQYTVTGYDTLDCTSQAVVIITVEDTGFIPNLFSPNGDGQNDQLRIYGVVSAQRFTFSIYDREGALVYKTSNVNEAVQEGWDGTKNGSKQPAGVYFWKLKGEGPSGQLLLNGKDSGSIVLIR